MLRLSDYDYALPDELIAQRPAARRDESRLLVVDRRQKSLRHFRFYDIINFLRPGDLLVLNDTRVMPARLLGRRRTGGRVEILLLEPCSSQGRCGNGTRWRALIKPLGRLKDAEEIFLEGGGTCRLQDARRRIVAFPTDAVRVMRKTGRLPLPPYVRREPDRLDAIRYQTVYARRPGAVAAPTAGLHFTRRLLAALRARGVAVAALTLHVGYGTFSPVRVEDIRQHRLEPEYYRIPAATARGIRTTKAKGGRIIAVGTTVCRALEHSAAALLGPEGCARPIEARSDLFIYPPFSFRVIDALVTNFHLPKTTLLMLTAAFGGGALIERAYGEAVRERYRFYSYGDAMFIL